MQRYIFELYVVVSFVYTPHLVSIRVKDVNRFKNISRENNFFRLVRKYLNYKEVITEIL